MTHRSWPAPRLAAFLLALPCGAMGAEPGRAEDPPPPPTAELAAPPPPFEPPRWRVAVSFGSTTSSGHSSVTFGGLIGYEIASGFELFLDGQYWGGAQPSVGRLAPGINWYAPLPYRPYLGVYFSRWFIGGQPDQDAIGGRAGFTLASTSSAAFGLGMVYEQALGCSLDCTAWWPEVSVGFRF